MSETEIKPGIFYIGVNDRTTDLFEGLWPITKEGVSYNSYLINDEKKAIIDLTKSIKAEEFFAKIDHITDMADIDYVIINHMEPDHSGLLKTFRRISPQTTLVGSAKTRDLLDAFFGITENVLVVKDGDMLSLGGRTLKFISTPFLHWPETIMTYELTDGILFTCDAFGSYGAIGGALFDDDCHSRDFYLREALRYYVNIVANYSQRVLDAIDKLKDLPVEVIAPSHGLVWRQNIPLIVNHYKKWAEYATKEAEPGITLVYGSMYGNTERVMNAVAEGISEVGVPLDIFDVARNHVSYILPSLWTKQGVMIGAPTYEVSLFPPMAEALRAAAHKRIRNKKAAYFGSYGWSGGALKGVRNIVEPLKWDITATFEFIGSPTDEDIQKAKEMGRQFADLIKSPNSEEPSCV